MLSQYKNFPPVQNFLLDPQVYDQFEEVIKKHELPKDRLEEFLDLTLVVMKGDIQLAKMPEMIASAFGVDQKKAKLIAADIAGYRLLPLNNYLPGVEEQIIAWGGQIKDYPPLRIEKKKETTDDKIVDLANEIGLDVPEHIKKRFAFITRGYLKKERSKEDTAKLMKRPINIGGLALTDTQVANVFEFIDEHADDVVVNEKKSKPDPKKESKSESEPEPGSKPEPKKEPSAVKPSVTKAELKAKLEKLQALSAAKKTTPDDDLSSENKQPKIELEQKTDVKPKSVKKPKIDTTSEPEPKKTSTQPTVKPKPHDLTTSVPVIAGELIADEEVVDVSSASRQLKKRGKKQKSDYDKQVNAAVADVSKYLAGICKKNRIARKTFDKLALAHIRGTRDVNKTHALLKEKHRLEGEDLAEVMKSLEVARKFVQNQNSLGDDQVSELAEDLGQMEKEVLNQRHASMTKKVADEDIESVLPNAQVSAARTKKEELVQQKAKIDQDKLKQAQVASKPKKAKAKLSMPSTPPGAGKVEDVKYRRKLVGPVDELGQMTPTEFRRLSSDPNEAVRKVEDKLALLESTSYEERIKGVKAWRQNPISKLYLQMTQEALQKGVAVAEIASQRRNAGEESLSPAEIKAIVGLNNRIKF